MATKRLARQLGILRRTSKTSLSEPNHGRTKQRQLFDYLMIVDFESTCWNDGKKHYSQEIIEFPAVLLNTLNGEIESEFHMYVQPQEHPVLSEFCTELTGIKQSQVDEGVPLHICLSQFSKWIQKLQKEKNVIFSSTRGASEEKLCAFVTWSDWDLGVCLQYECKRKQLRKPDVFNSWIDLRAVYKFFYSRKPKGLNGALQDVGIIFAGREHSGLDDSRNTARLAWKMISDGCDLKITKSLDKAPPAKNSIARFLSAKLPDGSPLGRNNDAKTGLDKSRPDEVTTAMKNVSEAKLQEFKSVPLHGNSHIMSRNCNKAVGCGRVQSCLTPQARRVGSLFGCLLPRCDSLRGVQNELSNEHLNSNNSGLVLVSTTLSSVNVSDTDICTTSDCLSMLADCEDIALIPESQQAHSSESLHSKASPSNKKSFAFREKMDTDEFAVTNAESESRAETTPSVSLSKAVLYKRPRTTAGYNKGIAPSNFPNASGFQFPTGKANITATDVSKGCHSTSSHTSLNTSGFQLPTAKANITTISVSKGNNSTSSCDAQKRKLSSPRSFPPAKKSPFSIYEDECAPSANFNLQRVPSGILNSSINQDQSLRAKETRKVTPPLCRCGRRAKLLTVSNAGPNHGKMFYSCPVGKWEGNRKGCGYFKWEYTLLKEKLALPPFTHSTGISEEKPQFNSSGNFQTKHPSLRPSMRT